ncbi:hypothetical protein B0H17DRAFT_1272355 [Mycena rosella]|uniref:Uncharacterized protein n=1 Tax=Mycena rosella TaxID=1033263 RepID=A0AAD7CGY9_MYCRO|nr:hypothetical protein B0H17DRAFT_1272355 [Mycena rosella]
MAMAGTDFLIPVIPSLLSALFASLLSKSKSSSSERISLSVRRQDADREPRRRADLISDGGDQRRTNDGRWTGGHQHGSRGDHRIFCVFWDVRLFCVHFRALDLRVKWSVEWSVDPLASPRPRSRAPQGREAGAVITTWRVACGASNIIMRGGIGLAMVLFSSRKLGLRERKTKRNARRRGRSQAHFEERLCTVDFSPADAPRLRSRRSAEKRGRAQRGDRRRAGARVGSGDLEKKKRGWRGWDGMGVQLCLRAWVYGFEREGSQVHWLSTVLGWRCWNLLDFDDVKILSRRGCYSTGAFHVIISLGKDLIALDTYHPGIAPLGVWSNRRPICRGIVIRGLFSTRALERVWLRSSPFSDSFYTPDGSHSDYNPTSNFRINNFTPSSLQTFEHPRFLSNGLEIDRASGRVDEWSSVNIALYLTESPFRESARVILGRSIFDPSTYPTSGYDPADPTLMKVHIRQRADTSTPTTRIIKWVQHLYKIRSPLASPPGRASCAPNRFPLFNHEIQPISGCILFLESVFGVGKTTDRRLAIWKLAMKTTNVLQKAQNDCQEDAEGLGARGALRQRNHTAPALGNPSAKLGIPHLVSPHKERPPMAINRRRHHEDFILHRPREA